MNFLAAVAFVLAFFAFMIAFILWARKEADKANQSKKLTQLEKLQGGLK